MTPARRLAAWWPEAAVLGFAALLVFGRLHLPLLEPEEGRYAEIPRQMLLGHHFLTPVYQSHPYLDKPPLLYWAVMASYAAFGVHDWSARLVTAAAAWLTVVVVYAWGRWAAARPAGLAAAAALALTGDFVYRGPMLTMNGPLALFVTAAVAAAHLWGRSGRPRWWVVSAACCAAGVLTKGPVAAALVLPPLLAMRWTDPTARRPSVRHWLGYAAVVAAVAGPWFAAETIAEPGFGEYFFYRHHVERYLHPFDHAKAWWFYLPQFTLAVLPWAALTAPTLVRRPAFNLPPVVRLAGLAAVWAVVFFSLSGSKRPVYLVPALPFLAVAAGGLIGRAYTRRTLLAAGVLAAVVTVGVFAWLPRYSEAFSVAALVERVREQEPHTPLLCYAHEWDSLGVYAGCAGDLPTPLATPAEVIGRLAGGERAVVFVHTAAQREELVRSLPPGWVWRPMAESRVAFAGVVYRE